MFKYYTSTFDLYKYEGGLQNVDINQLYPFRLDLMFFVYCCVFLCIVVYCFVLCALLCIVVYCCLSLCIVVKMWDTWSVPRDCSSVPET